MLQPEDKQQRDYQSPDSDPIGPYCCSHSVIFTQFLNVDKGDHYCVNDVLPGR